MINQKDREDCYFVAFCVPTCMMALSLIIFLAGRKKYVSNKPTGNVFMQFCRATFTALKVRFQSREVTVMLMTSLCWWLNDDDWFQMLVAKSLCWRPFSLLWRFSQCIKSVTNILNPSPTSQTWHQHIWSLTSVINITVSCKRSIPFKFSIRFSPISGLELSITDVF